MNNEDYSYYNDIITIPCGNYGRDNNVFTTKHEYDITVLGKGTFEVEMGEKISVSTGRQRYTYSSSLWRKSKMYNLQSRNFIR